jgi:hypothetical protein
LYKRTIDVAAEHGLDGVVIHSGSILVYLPRRRIEIVGPATSVEEGRRWLREALDELGAYGRARGVEPLVENMPGREYAGYGPVDRSSSVDVQFVGYQTVCELGQAGFSLCVDLGHLYTEMMVDEDAGHGDVPTTGAVNGLHECVRDAVARLVPYTRHVHLSTVSPPWNGTDGHSGFLESDYARGAIPGREQLLCLLEPFSGREVWLIPEPYGGSEVHLANYRRLAGWLRAVPTGPQEAGLC